MIPLLALLVSADAQASSLDYLEVGGPWGTPGTEDATALWWNPAGVAMGHGTRWQVELAPTIAGMKFDRRDPYGRGGEDAYPLFAPLPYAAIASDFNVEGLGVGAAFAVPFARGGGAGTEGEKGSGRFSMTEGQIEAFHFIAGGGYAYKDKVAIGGAFHVVRSSWKADLGSEGLTALYDTFTAAGANVEYTDDQIEDPDYAASLKFNALHDTAFTFSAGVQVQPIDQLRISGAYVHGYNVMNRGDLDLSFGCPPQEDTVGRFGVESMGLCNADVKAHAAVGYSLPGRVVGSVLVMPIPDLHIEAMGGWVQWSRYRDFDITVSDSAELNNFENEHTHELIDQNRLWARDNKDSFYGGLDVKGHFARRFTVGGRVWYDHHAVPTAALSPNNYDANDVILSGLGAVKIHNAFEVGLSYSHHFVMARENDESAYFVTLNQSMRPEDRWFYPQMNGRYTSSIDRIGLQIRGQIGKRVPKL